MWDEDVSIKFDKITGKYLTHGFHFNTGFYFTPSIDFTVAVLFYFGLNNLFGLGAAKVVLSGFDAKPVFDSPLTKSKTPTEFWTKRWNHMVHLVLKVCCNQCPWMAYCRLMSDARFLVLMFGVGFIF